MSNLAFPPSMRSLINELSKLPSIGERSAIRLAYHIVSDGAKHTDLLVEAIKAANEKIKFCAECFGFSESDICKICSNPKRDRSLVCVVEKPADVISLEATGSYKGLYHVLHGLWSPLRGITPEETRIAELVGRVSRSRESGGIESPGIEEVIIATATSVEGDATALFISKQVKEHGASVTRIAQGLPKGGDVEFADEITIAYALDGRRNL